MPYLFTSESVSEGHPDKICDAISDGVLDAIFAQDPFARVACETFVTTGLVAVSDPGHYLALCRESCGSLWGKERHGAG